MFREMRRKNKSIGDEQAAGLLKEGRYGVLSTAGENGYAYGVPLNYAYLDGRIYFHCALEGHKLDNISFNSKVSFCVVGDTEPIPGKFSYRYKSVIVFGRASEVSGKEKHEALVELVRKYSGDYMEQGLQYIERDGGKTKVFRVEIEHLTGKAGQ